MGMEQMQEIKVGEFHGRGGGGGGGGGGLPYKTNGNGRQNL